MQLFCFGTRAARSDDAFERIKRRRRTAQARALWLSTIAFTVCFAVWTIFSIIGIRIKQELGLTETEFGLLVGTPILTGSLVPHRCLASGRDRYGGRLVFTADHARGER